jgi:hypothetical protein
MTYEDVASMIESIGLPFAYYEFKEDVNNPIAPPFICFLYPESDDLMADNINYQQIRPLSIELYTDNKDFALEATVEATLNQHGLPFTRSETYISDEKMYMVTYDTAIVVTASTEE